MAFTSTQIPPQIRHHRSIGGYAGRHRAAGGHQEGGQRGRARIFIRTAHRRGGTRGNDDAFKKVSGALGCRRHRPANGSMAFASTQVPPQIRRHRSTGGYAGRHRAAGGHQEGGQRPAGGQSNPQDERAMQARPGQGSARRNCLGARPGATKPTAAAPGHQSHETGESRPGRAPRPG